MISSVDFASAKDLVLVFVIIPNINSILSQIKLIRKETPMASFEITGSHKFVKKLASPKFKYTVVKVIEILIYLGNGLIVSVSKDNIK